MGVIKQGIQGGFSGKVGPHVGSSWKGINVMRAMPTSVANPNTEAQQEQRSAFKQVSLLASSLLTSIVKPYWDKQAVRMSGYNLFVKTNIKFTSKGEGFSFKDLQMSVGRMDAPRLVSSKMIDGEEWGLRWDKSIVPMYGSNEDKAVMVLLDTSGNLIEVVTDGTTRADETINTSPVSGYSEDTVHAYLFFVSPDGKYVSKTSWRPIT